ncbi:MAG TPA: YncE family protein [Candidatus Binatia bacterium]|nr:YncE family protein [Candidatus Binatia bacterium]
MNSLTGKVYVGNQTDFTVTVIDEHTLATTTIALATDPEYIAVNEVTNKIYVTGGRSLTVIDGATNLTTTIALPDAPGQVVVNPVTNKIYTIANSGLIVIDGATLSAQTVPVGQIPVGIALNTATNKIYVIDQVASMFVVDGVTNNTTTVSLPGSLGQVVVNSYTNKIYVTSSYFYNNNWYQVLDSVDGTTLSISTLFLGQVGVRVAMGLNPRTDKVYVSVNISQYTNYLAIIDGGTLSLNVLQLGLDAPGYLAVEPVSDRIYITYLNPNYGDIGGLLVLNGATNSLATVFTSQFNLGVVTADSVTDRVYIAYTAESLVWVVAGPLPLKFVPVPPCRVVDTRGPDGQFGGPPIQGGTYRDFPLPQGACNIPPSAAAYSLNVTVVPQGPLGYLTVWPTGEGQPAVSTMNSVDGRVKANAAIVPSGASGGVSAYASNTTNVVLDINGYFIPSFTSALAFYPLTSCRLADTRGPQGPLGGPYLAGGQERDFPVLAGGCGIPATAQAYSLNITALPHGALGYLTVWPEGQQRPVVSTLNAPTGTATANAALVTPGTSGGIAVYPSNDTDLLIDVNGYFAPPGPGGMSLYTLLPCRVLDTRQGRGMLWGTMLIDVADSGCGLSSAQAVVLNATVVPQGYLGYLTIWPVTEFQPSISTLNAWDGAITSNMAIVTNIDGWLEAFAPNPTHLILDAFGYFAP